jgi:hypothetical protein
LVALAYNGLGGVVTITATFPNYNAAAALTISIQVTVTAYQRATMKPRPWPPCCDQIEKYTLFKIQCTDIWQRIYVEFLVTLTNNATKYDVSQSNTMTYLSGTPAVVFNPPYASESTDPVFWDDATTTRDPYTTTPNNLMWGQSAGTSTITGYFANLNTSKTFDLTAVTQVAYVTAIQGGTPWLGPLSDTMSGVKDSTHQTNWRVDLSDSTFFNDTNIWALTDFLTEDLYLDFTTLDAARATVGTTGIGVLLDNKPSSMYFTATSKCIDNVQVAPTLFVSGRDTFFPNLQPNVGEIDLGNEFGLQFTPTSLGGSFTVEVRFNAGDFPLQAFHMVSTFDPAHFVATSCTIGPWGGSWGCTRNDPASKIEMVATFYGSATNATVSVGTFVMNVVSNSMRLEPINTAFYFVDASSNAAPLVAGVGLTEFTALAGSGLVAMNSATRRHRNLLALEGGANDIVFLGPAFRHDPEPESEFGTAMETYSTVTVDMNSYSNGTMGDVAHTARALLQASNKYGDVNGDGKFTVGDVYAIDYLASLGTDALRNAATAGECLRTLGEPWCALLYLRCLVRSGQRPTGLRL